MSDYHIRIFDKYDYIEYCEKMYSIKNNTSTSETIARRKWWCFDNPEGGAFAAAFYEDSVVATCYISGKSLMLNGNIYKAFEIGETATDPLHQRKGLFSSLVKICTAYAFDKGASVVYGTPNLQSTPGYKKLDFSILNDNRSNLFFSPNLTGVLSEYLDLKTTNNWLSKPKSTQDFEISSDDYFMQSKDRIHLNNYSKEYFYWRFSDLGVNRYRFFRINDFSMAVREAVVGRFKVLLVSDYGEIKSKPDVFKAIKNIRKIFNNEFSCLNYSGIYFNGEIDKFTNKFKYGIKGLISHRLLPFCLKSNDFNLIDEFKIHGLSQLSDCDIG